MKQQMKKIATGLVLAAGLIAAPATAASAAQIVPTAGDIMFLNFSGLYSTESECRTMMFKYQRDGMYIYDVCYSTTIDGRRGWRFAYSSTRYSPAA